MLDDAERTETLERQIYGLRQISVAFATTLNIDDLLPKLMARISEIMNSERSTLFLVDPQKGDLWSKFLEGDEETTIRIPIDRGIAGEVARTGCSMIVDDAYAHPLFLPNIDRLTGFRTRTLLTVPLSNVDGELIGVVQVLNRKDGGPFDDGDRKLLESLALQISIALKTSWLYTSVVRHNRELDVISEIEREVGRIKDPEKILDRLLAKAIGALGCEAGSILLRQEGDRAKLYFRTAIGEKSEALSGLTISLSQGIAGWVVQNGRAARVNDVQHDRRYDPTLSKMVGFETRQVLAVPLVSDEGVIGAVEVLNRTGGAPFTTESARFLDFVAIQIVRAVESVRDVCEREQRERLATIGRMLSGVMHDLKTPMTVITSCADFLGGELDAERRKLLADRIIHQLKALGRMTEDLLAFARGESRVFIRKVFLHTFLDEFDELIRMEAADNSIRIRWQRDYDGKAWFDADSIRRSLLNICRNALDAMPEGGLLAIAVAREGDRLVFSVSDTGPGIPPAIRDTLFDPFVTSGKKDGTGLGLAIVRQAVTDHGGTVDMETEAGKGTTFTISLPLQPPEGKSQ